MLSDEERRILQYAQDGARPETIYNETGMTQTRYSQRLVKLLGRRDALEEFPVLVHRLSRLHDKVTEERQTRRRWMRGVGFPNT